jgi:N-acetylglucosaminyldiphosphoundecaprenol N-acetyl-beta-D-mannosaminyltransferase
MQKIEIIGVRVDLLGNEGTLTKIKEFDYSKSGYVCLGGLFEFLECNWNKDLANAFNNSFIHALHSPYISTYARLKGYKNTQVLDPVWLLTELLKEDVSHYFYGASEETLKKMSLKIKNNFPNANVIGYKSPPHIGINKLKGDKQLEKEFKEINKLRPNITWIGFGGVPQDPIMHYNIEFVDNSLMIGIGAVFDVFAENIKLRPQWVKKIGFAWLFYLVQQPVYRTKKYIKFFSKAFPFLSKRILNRKNKINE